MRGVISQTLPYTFREKGELCLKKVGYATTPTCRDDPMIQSKTNNNEFYAKLLFLP